MSTIIYIKPHHFIDIIREFGAGVESFEPHPYGHAQHTVAAQILNNRDVLMEMDLGIDDICKPCSHNIDGICDDTIDISFRPDASPLKREWNLLIDQRWCKLLGINNGERLTAREFCRRLRDSIGDIEGVYDVYREVPIERTAQRNEKVKEGIKKFLL